MDKDKNFWESKKWTMGALGLVSIQLTVLAVTIAPEIATAAAAAFLAIGAVVGAAITNQGFNDQKRLGQ